MFIGLVEYPEETVSRVLCRGVALHHVRTEFLLVHLSGWKPLCAGADLSPGNKTWMNPDHVPTNKLVKDFKMEDTKKIRPSKI